jgi:hypothetical protein
MTKQLKTQFAMKSFLLACVVLFLNSFNSVFGLPARKIRWIENNKSSPVMGTTVGVPWPQGTLGADKLVTVNDHEGNKVLDQTWPLAYWRDGSVKWLAVAIPPHKAEIPHFSLRATSLPISKAIDPPLKLTLEDRADVITIDTHAMKVQIAKSGNVIIPSVEIEDRETLTGGRLVALNQNLAGDDISSGPITVDAFESRIDNVVVEQSGPTRAVVRVEGHHANEDRSFLPFTIRMYFYLMSGNIRIVHTFIYDADEHKDFVRGLGVRFDVPMSDPLYDRHVRFVSAEGGLWYEAVKGITGLRRDPGENVRLKQVKGEALPDPATWDQRVTTRLSYIPTWNDYRLIQANADGFQIEKRTAPGHAWIRSTGGTHASGAGYIGGVSGGVAFGMKDFWQSHPSQIDIRNAGSESAETTLWFWAPEAQPMDLRFYHDGLGMTNKAEQAHGLAITYEDYAEKLGTPQGIARTSEVNLWVVPATPENSKIISFAKDSMKPPMLVNDPEQILESKVFGGIWSLPDRSTPTLDRIEDMLDHALESYMHQQEVHRWYGFWDYGDVMHSFDGNRNMWKYDIGGFGWANGELSPEIWLWTQFLRSGRGDVFRFAEAMTRHNGEVDVYHIGPMAPFGTRHNVQHWGDGMKQLRISTPLYRRYYYYLTADERTGDLLRNQVDAYKTYKRFDAFGKEVVDRSDILDPESWPMGLGTDLSAIAAGWFIEWERTGSEELRKRLETMMESIGKIPFGFFSVNTRFNTYTGEFVTLSPERHAPSLSHLFSVFGWPELNAELLQLFDIPSYREKWLQYSANFNASPDDRKRDTGVNIRRRGNLRTYYSRLSAFAAHETDNPELAARAWQEILGAGEEPSGVFKGEPRTVDSSAALNPFKTGRFMSTNWVSEWNNAMLQCLRWIGEYLPEDDPRTKTEEEQKSQ